MVVCPSLIPWIGVVVLARRWLSFGGRSALVVVCALLAPLCVVCWVVVVVVGWPEFFAVVGVA